MCARACARVRVCVCNIYVYIRIIRIIRIIHTYMHTYIHTNIYRVPPPPPPWAQKLLEQKRVRDTDGAPNDFVRFLRAASTGNTEEVIKRKQRSVSFQRNAGPQSLDRLTIGFFF